MNQQKSQVQKKRNPVAKALKSPKYSQKIGKSKMVYNRKNEKKWPEAIAAFQNCVALDANHSDAWFHLGYAYNQHNGGKSCEAEYEPYTRCIALDPKHAVAHTTSAIS